MSRFSPGFIYAGSGPSITGFANTANVADTNGGTSPISFTSVAIGSAASDRYIFLMITSFGRPTAVTVGGNSATKLLDNGFAIQNVQIWRVLVTSGTTATVTVTYDDGNPLFVMVSVFTAYKASGAPAISASSSGRPTGSSTLSSINTSVPAGGFYLAGILAEQATQSWSAASPALTGATNNNPRDGTGDAAAVKGWCRYADNAAGGSYTQPSGTFTVGAATAIAYAFASFL